MLLLKDPVEYFLQLCLSFFLFFFFLGKLSVNIISFDARVLGFSPTDFTLLREGGCTDTAFEKL